MSKKNLTLTPPEQKKGGKIMGNLKEVLDELDICRDANTKKKKEIYCYRKALQDIMKHQEILRKGALPFSTTYFIAQRALNEGGLTRK